jgi:hypothetical protein
MSSGDPNTLTQEVARLRDTVLHQVGMLGALEAAIVSLAEAHPNQAQLRANLERGFEIVESILLGQSPSDISLHAFQHTRARIAQVVERG